MPPTVIPMLPCADIDEVAEFMTALGFTVTYRQTRPNPFVATGSLHGAVRRADPSDPALTEAREFLAELDERNGNPGE